MYYECKAEAGMLHLLRKDSNLEATAISLLWS